MKLYLFGCLLLIINNIFSLPNQELLNHMNDYEKYGIRDFPILIPWKADKEFTKIIKSINLTYNLDIRYYQYIFTKHCCTLGGSIIECGSNEGDFINLIGSILDTYSLNIQIYAIDSFEGLPLPNKNTDGDVRTGSQFFNKGDLTANYQSVINKLKHLKTPIKIIKGWIPDCFNDLSSSEKYCMAHIDVDLYQPTLDSLKYIYEKMVTGGIILMDDYGSCGCYGAKIAADEFFKDKEEKIIPLFSGGAFVIKK
jgi:O-methyltransferase